MLAEKRDSVSNRMFSLGLRTNVVPSLLSLEEMVDILLVVAVQVEHSN